MLLLQLSQTACFLAWAVAALAWGTGMLSDRAAEAVIFTGLVGFGVFDIAICRAAGKGKKP